ncbi:MAG TPA: carbohydrate ABC transporter permease [Clostridia bacterium]
MVKSIFKRIKPLEIIIYLIIGLLVVCTILPFLNVISISLSSYENVVSNKAMLFPKGWTFDAYTVLMSKKVWISFVWTIVIVIASSVLHIIVCLLTAYPLSKNQLPGRKFLLLFILIPMLFSGGLVPYYKVLSGLGFVDNWMVFIVPGLFSGYNVILMKNFINQIPASMEEAARIDGAGYFKILFSILAPSSMPIIATLLLFYGVGKWNDWFTALIFINQKTYLYPLQSVLNEILTAGNLDNISGLITSGKVFTDSTKMAVTIFSIIPIASVYPFLQKYFVQGIFVGSVKD